MPLLRKAGGSLGPRGAALSCSRPTCPAEPGSAALARSDGAPGEKGEKDGAPPE